ncbi:hypothetical protein AB0442_39840 [Kitasatospora sp. NPDC085895]|uniref:hypothetical protein n=1 Tax=Kitasatospora sp. NPDC085895 TaxID=3155057 RepID=UPI00344D99EA
MKSHPAPTSTALPAPRGQADDTDPDTVSSREVNGRGWSGPGREAQSPRDESPVPGQAEGGWLRELVDQRLAQQAVDHPAPPHQPAAAAGETVTVPPSPDQRGLPYADVRVDLDPDTFGFYWALLGWTADPDVFLVTGEGRRIGWVERGLDGLGDRWVAVYEGFFLGDVATQEPALHDTPAQAALTVLTAYQQNL